MTLADSIIEENIEAVYSFLQYGVSLNQLDEYGYTPLIEAAIADNISIAKLLLEHGADANFQDANGSTALHWAAENNNLSLCELLLQHHANPNAYNVLGQPVLAMPLLRNQHDLKKLFLQYGADLEFAQDFANAKLLGHLFELVGSISIVDPQLNFVEVDLEGFYLEVTLNIIADSLAQFKNHFAARSM